LLIESVACAKAALASLEAVCIDALTWLTSCDKGLMDNGILSEFPCYNSIYSKQNVLL
jgi:hypothetical protein